MDVAGTLHSTSRWNGALSLGAALLSAARPDGG